MNKLHVYSSAPLSLSVVCAFQSLARKGTKVVVRPLSALPPAPQPGLRLYSLRAERTNLQLRLAVLGDQLGYIEDGLCRPEAGVEQGLRAERDALLLRVRAITAALQPPPPLLSPGA